MFHHVYLDGESTRLAVVRAHGAKVNAELTPSLIEGTQLSSHHYLADASDSKMAEQNETHASDKKSVP
jgi:hypothetical protein